jgi:hypothetical protein
MWDLWWTKWRWGRVSPSTSVSPANLYSTKFSILAITRGRYNRPELADVPSGPSLDSTQHSLGRCDHGFLSNFGHGCLVCVCVHLFCVCVVLYLRGGLETGRSLVQGILPIVYRSKKELKPRHRKSTV